MRIAKVFVLLEECRPSHCAIDPAVLLLYRAREFSPLTQGSRNSQTKCSGIRREMAFLYISSLFPRRGGRGQLMHPALDHSAGETQTLSGMKWPLDASLASRARDGWTVCSSSSLPRHLARWGCVAAPRGALPSTAPLWGGRLKARTRRADRQMSTAGGVQLQFLPCNPSLRVCNRSTNQHCCTCHVQS